MTEGMISHTHTHTPPLTPHHQVPTSGLVFTCKTPRAFHYMYRTNTRGLSPLFSPDCPRQRDRNATGCHQPKPRVRFGLAEEGLQSQRQTLLSEAMKDLNVLHN